MSAAEDNVLAYDEAMEAFDPVFGIEVHVELNTKTKMFCGCANEFGGEPNTQVCPVCLGLPGSMPVTNEKAVESAIRLGLALGCSIRESSRFARKNYFYPDLAKDYQISQYDEPTSYEGSLDVVLDDGTVVMIGIERAHMEEDAGKNTHVGGTGGIQGASHSLVDYNRGGVPLVEIVTKPIEGIGLRTAEVARAYVATIRDIVQGARDLRRPHGAGLASRRRQPVAAPQGGAGRGPVRGALRQALRDQERQLAARHRARHPLRGGPPGRAPRSRASPSCRRRATGTRTPTPPRPGRSKEEAEDYRYFPEPDLLPVEPSREWVEELRATLPEHPAKLRARLQKDWGFTDLEMRDVIAADALGLIEETVAAGAAAQAARKWWMGELARTANEQGVELRGPAGHARATSPSSRGSSTRARSTTSSRARCSRACSRARDRPPPWSRRAASRSSRTTRRSRRPSTRRSPPQPDVLAKIREGKVQAAGAIVGAVMKATGGQADAGRVREIILKRAGVEG